MAADSSIETIWRDLRQHLEWTIGFALILLFTRHPGPVATLRQRLEDGLRLRTQRLYDLTPETPDQTRGLVAEILDETPPDSGPVWIELWRNPSDPDWRKARGWLLHRLNERRFLLERDLRAPLILVLPAEARGHFYVDAPDLWTIRSFTAELVAPERDLAGPRHEAPWLPSAEIGPESAVEREWTRLWRNFQARPVPDPRRLNPADGFAAFDAAMERGAIQPARSIAQDVLQLCRSIREILGDTPQALRDLSIALDKVGDVERDLGDLAAARDAWRESLDLRRQLRHAFGDTPQALRDLSVSLDNVGTVERDLRDLAAAREAWRESLELCRQLRHAFGDTPQALRDLSVSLDNVGTVERDLGDLAAAREAFREGLDLRRQLCAAFPEHQQFQQDLAALTAKWAAFDPPQTSSAGS